MADNTLTPATVLASHFVCQSPVPVPNQGAAAGIEISREQREFEGVV